MRYKKLKTIAIGISLSMLLSACGNVETTEVVADTEGIKVEAETETEEPATIEKEGEEGQEEKAEPEETEEEEPPVVSYAEENGLEFCKDFIISTQAVRTNINDESDMEVADAEWTLKSISIEDGEDGKQIITIESECSSHYWTDRKNRQMYSAVLPIVSYFDLDTGKCFPNLNKTGDMELGYIVDVEWNGIAYNIDYTGSSEWDDDGDWTFDKESGGYIHPTTVHYVDKFVVEPQGYNSLGMIIEPLAISDMEGREDGVQEDDVLIKDVLDEREGCYLYSVMDMYEMMNDDSVDGDKGNTSTNTETQKESTTPKQNTSTNSSGSKDNTTPKQEQPTHTHSYTSSVTKNSTCTEEGVRTYTCSSCGDSYTESIPSTGHSWTTSSETISHPSTGHYETVTKKEAFCGCGATFSSQADLTAHQESGSCDYGNCGVREWTENVWVVDSESWDETITVTKCSVCGATQ